MAMVNITYAMVGSSAVVIIHAISFRVSESILGDDDRKVVAEPGPQNRGSHYPFRSLKKNTVALREKIRILTT